MKMGVILAGMYAVRNNQVERKVDAGKRGKDCQRSIILGGVNVVYKCRGWLLIEFGQFVWEGQGLRTQMRQVAKCGGSSSWKFSSDSFYFFIQLRMRMGQEMVQIEERTEGMKQLAGKVGEWMNYGHESLLVDFIKGVSGRNLS